MTTKYSMMISKYAHSSSFESVEPQSLTDFIEAAGTNEVMMKAVKKLYEIPNKPDNPIEWFRLYFKSILSEDTSGNFGGLELHEDEESLKESLIAMEGVLLEAMEMEEQNNSIIAKLKLEYDQLNNARSCAAKNYHEDGDALKKLRTRLFDYHYRIKPDPSYQASKSDGLLSDDIGNDGNMSVQGSLVEILPFESKNFPDDTSSNKKKEINEEDNVYDDYPMLYFSKTETDQVQDELTEDEHEPEPLSEDADGEFEYNWSTEEEEDSDSNLSQLFLSN